MFCWSECGIWAQPPIWSIWIPNKFFIIWEILLLCFVQEVSHTSWNNVRVKKWKSFIYLTIILTIPLDDAFIKECQLLTFQIIFKIQHFGTIYNEHVFMFSAGQWNEKQTQGQGHVYTLGSWTSFNLIQKMWMQRINTLI